MAYTAPTFAASSQTWANLGTRGLAPFATTVAAAISSPTAISANGSELLGKLLTPTQAYQAVERARNVIDAYTSGKTTDKTSIKTQLYDLQCAFGTLNAALGEIGVLVDAN